MITVQTTFKFRDENEFIITYSWFQQTKYPIRYNNKEIGFLDRIEKWCRNPFNGEFELTVSGAIFDEFADLVKPKHEKYSFEIQEMKE